MSMSFAEAEPQWPRRCKEANMAQYISSFISPLGMILIEILDGENNPVLTLTTEVITGHVAVYHGDRIWRVKADPNWSLGDTALALFDLAHEVDLPEDLRTLGLAALQNSLTKLCARLASATA